MIARPQHADGELAVGVELGAQVATDGGLALLGVDLLDAGRGGGAAVGPYSEPGKVCRSTASATSKRWSSAQLTMLADSGVPSGQFRQSPLLARLKALLVLEPVLGTGSLLR
ncbi:hypothetical protein IWGMT90018_61790 [Mycobacterium kiyosense]|nr:hypothetical protein IWGMT90018_61790 [Mycobacterium kiyosense]